MHQPDLMMYTTIIADVCIVPYAQGLIREFITDKSSGKKDNHIVKIKNICKALKTTETAESGRKLMLKKSKQ